MIFSREERRKLVFRVEAQLAGDAALPLGLPVTVLPTGARHERGRSETLAPTSSSTSRG